MFFVKGTESFFKASFFDGLKCTFMLTKTSTTMQCWTDFLKKDKCVNEFYKT